MIATDPLPEDGAHAVAGGGRARRLDLRGDALALLNRAIHGHRLSASDPYVREVSAEMALATRVGYGSGEQVADGDWEEARELPPPKPSSARCCWCRSSGWRRCCPGRDVALACEELTLRARLDLDQGRSREAALQLSLALDAALAELEGWRGERGRRHAARRAAGHARDGRPPWPRPRSRAGLQPEQEQAVEAALKRLEATLRARVAEL